MRSLIWLFIILWSSFYEPNTKWHNYSCQSRDFLLQYWIYWNYSFPLFSLFQEKNHWTSHVKWWIIWKVNYMTHIAEEGTSCLTQENLSNKTGGTVAQNTPSQEDPFSLGYPHASIVLSPPAPGTQRDTVCQAVTGRGWVSPLPSGASTEAGAGRQQSLAPVWGLNQHRG